MRTSFTDTVLREIDFDLPQKAPESLRVADDCIRLFDTADEDFRWVKEQSWYRNLWRTVGHDHLETLGRGCRHLAQARGFVLELLRVLVAHAPGAGEFLDLITSELAHLATRRGRLAGPLAELDREVRQLAERVQWRAVHLDDEKALPESVKVLILRAMIAAAWADGKISDAEIALISRKTSSLGLSQDAAKQVLEEIKSPEPLDQDLAAIEDYSLRLHLYRNIAAVAIADGKISLTENILLGHLAQVLRIEEQDSHRVEQELFAMVSNQGLQTLVRTVAEGLPEEGADAPAGALGPEELDEWLAQCQEVWVRLAAVVARRSSLALLSPVRDRMRALSQVPHVREVLQALDARALRAELRALVPQVAEHWDAVLDEVVGGAVPLPDASIDLGWSARAGEDFRASLAEGLAPLLDELDRLQEAEERALAALDGGESASGLPPMLRILGDPGSRGGMLLALGDPHLQQVIREKKSEQAVQTYFGAVRRLVAASERAGDRMIDLAHAAGVRYFRQTLAGVLADRDVEREDLAGFLSVVAAAAAEAR